MTQLHCDLILQGISGYLGMRLLALSQVTAKAIGDVECLQCCAFFNRKITMLRNKESTSAVSTGSDVSTKKVVWVVLQQLIEI